MFCHLLEYFSKFDVAQVYLDNEEHNTVMDDLFMVIPNLKEHTQYMVAVAASTSAGEGESTSVLVLTAASKCMNTVIDMKGNCTHT